VATVKEREGELVRLKRELPRDAKDEVLEAAVAEVKEVARSCDLIAALGRPAMQEKHWVKVWALVESPPATLLTFTLD